MLKAMIFAAALVVATAAGALAGGFDFEIDDGGVAASDFDCRFNFTRGEPPCGQRLPVQRRNGEEHAAEQPPYYGATPPEGEEEDDAGRGRRE